MTRPDQSALRSEIERVMNAVRNLGAVETVVELGKAGSFPGLATSDFMPMADSFDALKLQTLQVLGAVQVGDSIKIPTAVGEITLPASPLWTFTLRKEED